MKPTRRIVVVVVVAVGTAATACTAGPSRGTALPQPTNTHSTQGFTPRNPAACVESRHVWLRWVGGRQIPNHMCLLHGGQVTLTSTYGWFSGVEVRGDRTVSIVTPPGERRGQVVVRADRPGTALLALSLDTTPGAPTYGRSFRIHVV